MTLVYVCFALAIVTFVLACVIAWAVFGNRRALQEVGPLRTELAKATTTAAHLVESIDTTAQWVAQYKHVLSNNVNLNKQIAQLTQSNAVLHGQTVELTDMLQNVNSVVRAQWTALERRDRAIGELVPLVEQLVKALDERKGEKAK